MALFPFAALTDNLMSSPHQGLRTLEPRGENCLGTASKIPRRIAEECRALTEMSPAARCRGTKISQSLTGRRELRLESYLEDRFLDVFLQKTQAECFAAKLAEGAGLRASAWVNMFFRKPVIRVLPSRKESKASNASSRPFRLQTKIIFAAKLDLFSARCRRCRGEDMCLSVVFRLWFDHLRAAGAPNNCPDVAATLRD